jgi:hypothetical protein
MSAIQVLSAVEAGSETNA